MYNTYLLLGGAGLVGTQVCRQLIQKLSPKKIIVASLTQQEAVEAVARIQTEFGKSIEIVPASGNLFVPTALAHTNRNTFMEDPTQRAALMDLLYGEFEEAFAVNHLAHLVATYKPDVIVDCVNTATGLSYQNVFDGARKVLQSAQGKTDNLIPDIEKFLLSQSVPQLIRHVRIVHRATVENDTKVYIKVGTTGTGGMGLNIPYTHSEDKPSKQLLAKTEAAFGHTGLLFLLARTPGGPIVKEVKPAAMIGYRAVKTIPVKDKNGNDKIFTPKAFTGSKLNLRESPDTYTQTADLKVSVVDTGENGLFTRGEFAAITALGQMEYVTPEEIAAVVLREIRGASTGQDIISALDSAVLNPSYKAGLLRSVAMADLAEAEAEAELPSIALGRLGPPALSKLLFEAHFLKEACGSLTGMIQHSDGRPMSAEDLFKKLENHVDGASILNIAPSVGIPIILPNGETILRGPSINVPEVRGHDTYANATPKNINKWAAKGWVDLRFPNIQQWHARAESMVNARFALRDAGSAAANRRSYLPDIFEIGEVVAWIFNNELDGHRIE